MKTKEIKIAGKDVTLAYCFGSEIGYKMLTDEDVHPFITEAIVAINEKPARMPDLRKTIYLILACATAYYESKGQESPLEDIHLMYNCEPEELGIALGTILNLYAEFYHLPKDEPKDKDPKGGKKRKNV
jgi:hypothetical protein